MLVLMLVNIGDWFSCQGVRLQQAGVDAGKYMGLTFAGSYDVMTQQMLALILFALLI